MTGLRPLFDSTDKAMIINGAMKVLEEIGIECKHKKTLEILGQKAGVSVYNGRIHLYSDEIMEYLDRKRDKANEGKKENDEFSMLGPWCSFEICDPGTGTIRLPTDTEVINAAKLIDSITTGHGYFGGSIPLYMNKIPARLATLKAEETAVIYTKNLGGKLTVTDRTEIMLISEMYRVVGRRYKLALQGMISPLRLNPEIMDTFFEQDGNSEIDIEMSCAIPMAGATAPVIFPAGLIQAVAEAIALDYIFNILSDRNFDSITIRLEPFDMKSNNIVFGSPEWCILNRAVVEIETELRGYPRRYGVFRSNSRKLDAQSMCERSMSALMQALNGIRKFGAVGQLCVDEVFSPVQAVLDIQILKYVKRVVRGFSGTWDEHSDYMKILREGIEEGTFISHESTVDNFRKFYSFDHMFDYCNLNTWRLKGMKGIEEDARAEVERIIKNHDYELDDRKKALVREIYREGEKLLTKTKP